LSGSVARDLKRFKRAARQRWDREQRRFRHTSSPDHAINANNRMRPFRIEEFVRGV
jgi:hypothetical protein